MIQPKSADFLRIDINSGQVRKSIAICQSDTVMRTIIFTLSDDGNVVDLSNCLYAELLINKVSGFEADKPCVIDGNTIVYTFSSTDISDIGTNLGQLILTFDDTTTLTTPPFEIQVYSKVINPRKQKSLDEYTAIQSQAASALASANSAEASANSASLNATRIEGKAEEAEASAQASADSADDALTYSQNAEASANSAAGSAEDAEGYKNTVQQLANDILSWESHAQEYAGNAATSATNAALSATNAETSATNASTSATNAAVSAADASISEYNASIYEDGAEYYYEQSKLISESFSGALKAMGTITFAELPDLSDANNGDMYNISDAFTTTSDFVEGAGNPIAAGANVYKIEKDDVAKWDILSPSVVSGVKGSAETYYRKGNINITAENLGLSGAALTNSYEDLDDKPTVATTTKAGLMSASDKTSLNNFALVVERIGYPYDPTNT